MSHTNDFAGTGAISGWNSETFAYGGGSASLARVGDVATPDTGAYGESYYAGETYTNTRITAKIASLPADGGDMGMAARVVSPDSAAADGYRLRIFRNAGTDTFDFRNVVNSANPGTQVGTTG